MTRALSMLAAFVLTGTFVSAQLAIPEIQYDSVANLIKTPDDIPAALAGVRIDVVDGKVLPGVA